MPPLSSITLTLTLTLTLILLPSFSYAISSCRMPGLSLVWKRENGLGPSTLAPPYLVTAAPAHYVSLIDVHTAKSVPGWPFTLPAATFAAAPLILDYDGDDQEEVLIFTSDGVILGVSLAGVAQADQSLRLGALEVPLNWYVGLDAPNVRASLSLVQRPPSQLPLLPPSRTALQAAMPAALNWTGAEKWLPKEGLESLSLFLRHSHAVEPRAHGTPGDAAMAAAEPGPQLQHSHLKGKDSVLVPPHILATPVAADLGDGLATLLIPVSYFIDVDSTAERERLEADGIDPSKYVAGGLVAVAHGVVLWHREFDVTMQGERGDETLRAFMRTRPVPIDLDRDGRSEIIVATDSGRVYVLTAEGQPVRWGAFPLEHTAVLATPVADDLQGDGDVEILVLEMTNEERGRLHCYDWKGAAIWSIDFEGLAQGEPLLMHLDTDGVLDVAWGTAAGLVYAVRGDTGQLLPNFPVALGASAAVYAPLRPFTYMGTRALVAPCMDGYLAFISLPSACVDRIDLAEPLAAPLFLGDLSQRGALEMLATSVAGHAYLVRTNALFHPAQAWHARAKGSGVQHEALAWHGVHFAQYTLGGGRVMAEEVSGTHVTLHFDIVDARKPTLKGRSYAVRVQLDSHVLLERTYSSPGRQSDEVALPDMIGAGAHLLTIRMRNELGQESGDYMHVHVQPRTERVVRWLLLLPLALLFVLLRLVRESPDLLPQ